MKNLLKRYNIDITALQEIRWKGNGQDEDRVGLDVRGKTRFCITRWTPINERLCMLRIKAKFFYITIICAHALTEEANDEAKDIFYEQLDKAYSTIPAFDI